MAYATTGSLLDQWKACGESSHPQRQNMSPTRRWSSLKVGRPLTVAAIRHCLDYIAVANLWRRKLTVLAMPRRRLILFVILLALVGACSAPSGPATSSDGRSIVIGAGSEPDT